MQGWKSWVRGSGTGKEQARLLSHHLACEEIEMFRESKSAGKLPCWELWRQDDNGVRALIACFEDRQEALDAMVRYESRRHKQTYWIEKKSATASSLPPSTSG